MDDLLLEDTEVSERLRAWLERAPAPAFAITLERLSDGRVLLRPLLDIEPSLLAKVRVTMAKYREALMNLT